MLHEECLIPQQEGCCMLMRLCFAQVDTFQSQRNVQIREAYMDVESNRNRTAYLSAPPPTPPPLTPSPTSSTPSLIPPSSTSSSLYPSLLSSLRLSVFTLSSSSSLRPITTLPATNPAAPTHHLWSSGQQVLFLHGNHRRIEYGGPNNDPFELKQESRRTAQAISPRKPSTPRTP